VYAGILCQFYYIVPTSLIENETRHQKSQAVNAYDSLASHMVPDATKMRCDVEVGGPGGTPRV
jgi:hypothetical protein